MSDNEKGISRIAKQYRGIIEKSVLGVLGGQQIPQNSQIWWNRVSEMFGIGQRRPDGAERLLAKDWGLYATCLRYQLDAVINGTDLLVAIVGGAVQLRNIFNKKNPRDQLKGMIRVADVISGNKRPYIFSNEAYLAPSSVMYHALYPFSEYFTYYSERGPQLLKSYDKLRGARDKIDSEVRSSPISDLVKRVTDLRLRSAVSRYNSTGSVYSDFNQRVGEVVNFGDSIRRNVSVGAPVDSDVEGMIESRRIVRKSSRSVREANLAAEQVQNASNQSALETIGLQTILGVHRSTLLVSENNHYLLMIGPLTAMYGAAEAEEISANMHAMIAGSIVSLMRGDGQMVLQLQNAANQLSNSLNRNRNLLMSGGKAIEGNSWDVE